jgi:aspartyl/asparaginyl beta-hydroxylase (cupin superfamily)
MRARLMKVLQLFLRQLEKLLTNSSRVPNRPFFKTSDFPWSHKLEQRWSAIRKELDDVMRHRNDLPNFQDLSPDQRHLSSDDGWKTYFFYAYGLKAWRNCRRCPETTRLLKGVPGMKTAFFSILAPGKHLPPHRGPFKGVLRYHLGLIIPKPETNCAIKVDGELRHWEEGKSLIFDDTYMHEAWNETNGDRVVLFMDFVRPLRFPASFINWILIKAIAMSPFVLGAAGNYLAWEKRFEKLVNDEKKPVSA